MPLTWQDLKETFTPESWADITRGGDEVELGERFLSMARAWLRAKLSACGVSSWNEDGDEVIRQVVLYRARYEAYAYVEQEALAEDKRQAAEELLRGLYGSCVEGGAGDRRREGGVFYPHAAVTPPSEGWRGFKA